MKRDSKQDQTISGREGQVIIVVRNDGSVSVGFRPRIRTALFPDMGGKRDRMIKKDKAGAQAVQVGSSLVTDRSWKPCAQEWVWID